MGGELTWEYQGSGSGITGGNQGEGCGLTGGKTRENHGDGGEITGQIQGVMGVKVQAEFRVMYVDSQANRAKLEQNHRATGDETTG
jgi:hypothetical protein